MARFTALIMPHTSREVQATSEAPTIQEFREQVLWLLGDEDTQPYAYNSCEICREVNGLDPFTFKGCFHKFDANRRGPRCRFQDRGCSIRSQTVYERLRAMERLGLIKSVKMRWLDGRDPGAAENRLQWDNFRFWFRSKAGLAVRLIQDVQIRISPVSSGWM